MVATGVELPATVLSTSTYCERGGEGDVPVRKIHRVVIAPKEDAPSNTANAALAMSALADNSAAHVATRQKLEGIQILLHSLCSIPDELISSRSVEVMIPCLQRRMQLSGLAPISHTESGS